MHDRLQQYVREIRALATAPLTHAEHLSQIRGAARSLFAEGFTLATEQRETPPEGYGRHLLHRDPDHGFVVIAMVWPAGHRSGVHDHGCWGVVGVLEGMLDVTDFDRLDDGSRPGYAEVRERSRCVLQEGQVASVLPPSDEHHDIHNASGRTAISVHTYGCENARCRVFDPDTRSYRYADLRYTSEPDAETLRATANALSRAPS